MVKYSVFGVVADPDGTFDIPPDGRIIGAFYHPVDGTFNVVMLKEVSAPKVNENPESTTGKAAGADLRHMGIDLSRLGGTDSEPEPKEKPESKEEPNANVK